MTNREVRRSEKRMQAKSKVASAIKPSHNKTNSRKSWVWGILSLLLFVCGGFAATTKQHSSRQSVSIQQAESHSGVKEIVKPISDATSPSRPRSIDDEDVDPATWRDLELVMAKPDGGKLEMGLLRPLWWIAEVGAQEGKTIRLSVPEMGVEGPTKVLSVKPMKPKKSKPRNGLSVVTGTFKHSSANVLDLKLESEAEPIGVTYSHPFRSADRKDWIAAGELKVGERVETRTGTTKVISIKKRPGQVPVYNLEVHKQHTYFVGKSGAWVHNSCLISGQNVGETVTNLPYKPVQGWVSKAHVDEYVRRLKTDAASVWNDLNPREKIIVDQYGNLLNGHHRVVAAQIAGVPIPESAIQRVTVANPMTGISWTEVIVRD